MRQALDFIVIGAQKSATSSLFEHLRAHPGLYIPPEKEYPFFSHDEIYARGWPAFLSSAFRGAPEDLQWGTVTPWYMVGCPVRAEAGTAAKRYMHGGTERIIPERIRAQLPDAKLVAILRDPVARCISHYGLDVLFESANRKLFDPTIDDLLTPAVQESARLLLAPTYVAWGEYGRILAGYYEIFPPEQIFVCFTSDLERAPREFMRMLFEYLGVDRGLVPANLGKRYRAGATSPRIHWLPAPADLERRLASLAWARSLWRSLSPRIQGRVLRRSREANYRFRLWNRGGPAFDAREASAETLAHLRAHYEDDRVLLEHLIGKPVPWGADGEQALTRRQGSGRCRPTGSRRV